MDKKQRDFFDILRLGGNLVKFFFFGVITSTHDRVFFLQHVKDEPTKRKTSLRLPREGGRIFYCYFFSKAKVATRRAFFFMVYGRHCVQVSGCVVESMFLSDAGVFFLRLKCVLAARTIFDI